MTVARILAGKGRSIATVPPHATLRDVVDVLAAKHIGALIVVDESGDDGLGANGSGAEKAGADGLGAMVGIVSERDVVRAIARRGVDALEDHVSDHMTREVITATETESVTETVRKMSKGKFRHMPVLNNGKLAGIVSIGDAIKYRLEQVEVEHSALRDYIATA